MLPIEAILFEPVGCFVETAGDAAVFEDVIPALTELKAMGIELFLVERFNAENGLADFFSDAWSASPERTIYLTAGAEGIRAARALGVSPVLMMNDPDEAMRLTAEAPAGGIVSLRELPDYVRLVEARCGGAASNP
jgi:hypothetical protein